MNWVLFGTLLLLVTLGLVSRRGRWRRLRPTSGLGLAVTTSLIAIATLAASIALVSQNANWACPEAVGCRAAAFLPADSLGQLHMLHRGMSLLTIALTILTAVVVQGVGATRAQRSAAGTTALLAMSLGIVYATLRWSIEPALFHVLLVGGSVLLVASGLLTLVLLRRNQAGLPVRPVPTSPGIPSPRMAMVRDLVALTKPRVISLLILTTLATMLIAVDEAHPLSFGLVVWTLIGGYLAAGGANAINMYLDRDVDALMGRTSRRPLPSSRLSPVHALIFGLALNVLAFLVLVLSSNLLAALIAIGGSVYYVVIYTRLLKRTTHHNIIIGGAAGAVPPLVGWAAVQGQINLIALILFAIIFYWTPPHFWALALMRRADYARAGIPMLPVAKGEDETKLQILLYSVLMVAISIIPAPLRLTGPIYLLLALVLGIRFLQFALKLFREPGTNMAWPLYKYSLLYLALLFGALVVDHLVMLSLA